MAAAACAACVPRQRTHYAARSAPPGVHRTAARLPPARVSPRRLRRSACRSCTFRTPAARLGRAARMALEDGTYVTDERVRARSRA